MEWTHEIYEAGIDILVVRYVVGLLCIDCIGSCLILM